MDHAPDGTVARAEFVDKSLDGRRVRHVERSDDDLRAVLLHLRDERASDSSTCPRRDRRADVGGAPPRQPVGGGEAQSARSAYDDIEAGVGRRRFSTRRPLRADRAGRYNDLSNMLEACMLAERSTDLMGLEHPVGQRTQFPCWRTDLERDHHLTRHVRLGRKQLVEIDTGYRHFCAETAREPAGYFSRKSRLPSSRSARTA